MAQRLYHVIQPYLCQICHQGELNFITNRRATIQYRGFLDSALTLSTTKEILSSKHVKFLQCSHCKRIFVIDWTKGWPVALTNPMVLHDFGVM